jgi:hypothetical protein
MIALFYDPPILDDHDAFGVDNGRKTVGNHERSPTMQEVCQGLLDNTLGLGIDTIRINANRSCQR